MFVVFVSLYTNVEIKTIKNVKPAVKSTFVHNRRPVVIQNFHWRHWRKCVISHKNYSPPYAHLRLTLRENGVEFYTPKQHNNKTNAERNEIASNHDI